MTSHVDVSKHAPRGLILAGWVFCGALWGFGLLAIMSIGFILLPLAGVLTFGLERTGKGKPDERNGCAVAGFGLALLLIAFLNRSGPGTVCSTTPNSVSCADLLHPLPWLLAGLVFVIAGTILFIRCATQQSGTGRP